jgi:hypothetical protein
VAGRGDPRAAVDVHAHVPLLGQLRLAGVQSHAHTHRRVGQRLPGALGRGEGVGGPGEGDEERVALRVHLDAAVGRERVAQQPPVFRKQVGVVVAVLGQQARRAVHVGEQERDRAAGELTHA